MDQFALLAIFTRIKHKTNNKKTTIIMVKSPNNFEEKIQPFF